MDHSDIAATSELYGCPLTALHVRIPLHHESTASSPASGQSRGGSSVSSLAKPTLGPATVFIPVQQWVPDKQVVACMASDCQTPFTFLRRKHHCRVCGRIFCASCSSNVVLGADGQEVRLCSSCYYEHQLVIARRTSDGELRRHSRGALKLLQRARLVEILSFLPLRDLLVAGAVSSDFYFMSRDNQIWFVHNMARWAAMDSISTMGAATCVAPAAQPEVESGPKGRKFSTAAAGGSYPAAAAAAGSSSLQKAVISLHCRYNFTQFLDFSRRVEVERCQGLSTFASSAKQLLSSNIKVCVVGPSGIGKTALVQSFVAGGAPAESGQPSDAVYRSTSGFVVSSKRVALVGGLSAEAVLSIFDVCGDTRYDALRLLCAQNCHVVVVLYNAHSKLSLVQAATLLSGLEPDLGPQPVVVCGLATPHRPREVSTRDAEGISVRCKVSIHAVTPVEVLEAAVQATLDTLVQVMSSSATTSTEAAVSPSSSGGTQAAFPSQRSVAVSQQLLMLSIAPTVLDVLLDAK